MKSEQKKEHRYESETGAGKMKTKRIVPAMMCAWICLTGCGGKTDLTFQKNDVPVIPAETTFLQQTDVRAADETETAAGITETRTK